MEKAKLVMTDERHLDDLTAELSTLKEQLREAVRIGESQAADWDRFWEAMGVLSEDVTVDDAIAKYKSIEEQLRLTNEMLAAAKRIEFKGGAEICSWSVNQDLPWAACDVSGGVIGHFGSILEAYAAIKPVQQGD